MTSDPHGTPHDLPRAPAITEMPPPVDDGWRQANGKFILIGALRNFRGFVLPLGFLLVTRGFNQSRQDLIWYGLALAAALISVVTSVLQWWFYRYRISDREITLRSGFISKQERVIPFERIQSIDIHDAPLERLLGVVQVKIDTGAGGSSESEIALQAIPVNEAAGLRSQLLAARQRLRGDAVAPATADGAADVADQVVEPTESDTIDEGEVIRRLSTRELLIAGATSGRIGAAAAIAGVLIQFGEQLVPRSMWERLPWEGLADAVTQLDVLAFLAITIGVIAWVISIVATVLTYGNFEIRRLGDQLQVRHGLLDRRQTTIPVRRIQAVRVVEGLLRQPFGFAEVKFDSAGFGADEGASGVLCPLLPRSEVPAFLQAASPDFAQDLNPPDMQKLPRRAMRRYIMAACIGWVLFVAIGAAAAWRFTDIPFQFVLLALVLTPAFAWLGYRRYLDAGYLTANGRLLLRWRGVSRVTVLTQVRRLQYRELTVDPFQRRARLVTFRTAVASGGSQEGFSLPHLDRTEAEALLTQLGRRSRATGKDRAPRPLLPVDAGAGTG